MSTTHRLYYKYLTSLLSRYTHLYCTSLFLNTNNCNRFDITETKKSFPCSFEHLRIRLQDIKEATNNFDETNIIGKGGSRRDYKGELILSGRRVMAAIKRFNPKSKSGQGMVQFWNEITMLSHFNHKNIISLVDFSNDDGESILVYEYQPNQSLDMHLGKSDLSWINRLHICIGAARGLKRLHNPKWAIQHRDIKSSNILLDTKWNAKISDFGLKTFIPPATLFTPPVGTYGYSDPPYAETGFLTNEADVYSFGVVLFEVLCGRLVENDNRPLLLETAKSCYKERKMHAIVLDCLQEQISPDSLDKFSAIAYRCLHEDHTKRPSAAEIVKELRKALLCQAAENSWRDGRLNSRALSPLVKNTRIYDCVMRVEFLHVKPHPDWDIKS